jgi:hypothetical protein
MKLIGPDELHRAARAAADVSEALTGSSVEASVLHVSRHITVLLASMATVARILPFAVGDRLDTLTRELDVVFHLSERNAPIVPLSPLYPVGPHIRDGFAMTFWPYVEHSKADYDNPQHLASAARALHQVHRALSDYPGLLPSIRAKIGECGMLLGSESELPALPKSDRELLFEMYNKLNFALEGMSFQSVPIHGDAHLGNVLFSAKGPLWTDFDAASLGPPEWDIGFVGDRTAFEPINPALYEVLSLLRSVCVSTWCWANPNAPGKLQAAKYHLEHLKSQRGGQYL